MERFFHSFRLITMYPAIGEKVNLKILRAIRVLRPLKLVSRVPSKFDSSLFEINLKGFF